MTPDPIVRHSVSATRQSFLLDDLSLALSRSSSHDDFNELLDNMDRLDTINCAHLNGNSTFEQDELDEFSHEQCKFEIGESSASGYRNIVTDINSGYSLGERESDANTPEVIVMPLAQWNEAEAIKTSHPDPQCQRKLKQASMLRKITVGFGIATLLKCVSLQHNSYISNYSWNQLQALCSVDNFVVEFIKDGTSSESGWEVRGVDMITPFVSVRINTSSLPSNCNAVEGDFGGEITGRNVVAEITSHGVQSEAEALSDSDSMLCHLLGVLLHFLFTGRRCGVNQHVRLTEDNDHDVWANEDVKFDGRSIKKNSLDNIRAVQRIGVHNDLVKMWRDSHPLARDADFTQGMPILGQENAKIHSDNRSKSQVNLLVSPLVEFGFPPSLSQLVANLVDCGFGLFRPDASYRSLDVAISDMQVLLRGPHRFLFDGPPSKESVFTGNGRLYGRSKEIASLTEAFWRVASTGESESIFVNGFSGCGKTRLVSSIFESVRFSGGYAVTRKFDEMQSSSPLAVVLSAFNDLCILVAKTSSRACRMIMYKKLSNIIPFLTRVLPNIVDLLPSHVTLQSSSSQADTEINFNSVCFTIQQLMRVLSSPSRPILLFLDDLQWADYMSLKLIQSVLSDTKGFNCMLFVGGFRDNEVDQDHVLLEFFNTLSTFNITTSMMNLHGISTEDMNSLISETLGIFPRMCKSLSDVVFRKTNGNPYFALEFLRSLIDRDAITYSLRKKHWEWDINQISAENITDNVLHILKNKMRVLKDDVQTTLKVVACFGINISIVIAKKLAATPQYRNLQATLDQVVVKEGFMDFDGTNYRFVHDKVREAAYGLIPPGKKYQYHFTIGMALQSNFSSSEDDTSVLFATIDQINRCPPTMFHDDSQRIAIANLNYEAGIKALKFSNFMPARAYMKAAVTLLPENSWTANYDFSLKCNFHFAKAAYSCGYVDQAKEILDEVIHHGEALEDKSHYMLDSYSLLVSLFYLARKDLLQAFHTCIKVLNLLGENLPIHDNVNKADLIAIVTKTKTLFQKKSNEELLAIHEETSRRNIAIMQFYDQLSIVSYLAKPNICPYYMARWAHFSLTQNVSCQYTPGAFVSFSSILCCENLDEDARIACRIGKIGILLSRRNNSAIEKLPGVYLLHYVYVGSLIEPIQACANMMWQAYEVGMQTGDPSKAAFNLSIMVSKQIKAGTNLLTLKREIANYLKLACQHAQKQLQCNLLMMNKIVSRLIGDEIEEHSLDEQGTTAWEESEFSLEIMTSFYLGHMERVYHKSKLWDALDDSIKKKVPFRVIYISFLSGLASASLYSYGKKNSQRHLSNVSKSLNILEKAEGFSMWNFKNKASLLRAALLAITSEDDAVIQCEFNRAILSSRSSKFIHEEGLACELAGMHYKKKGIKSLALSFFRQAKFCYSSWGSLVKVQQMVRQIELTDLNPEATLLS